MLANVLPMAFRKLPVLPAEGDSVALLFRVATKLKVLSSSDGNNSLMTALGALKLQSNLTRGLRLFPKHRFRLSAVT